MGKLHSVLLPVMVEVRLSSSIVASSNPLEATALMLSTSVRALATKLLRRPSHGVERIGDTFRFPLL